MSEIEKTNKILPNLYLKRSPDNYILDGEPRALYWASYRKKYVALKELIVPGNQVPLNECLCIVAKNLLQPNDFDLKRKDRMSFAGVERPGKSAHVFFSENPHEVCGAIMDRDLKRQDAIYVAFAKDIVNAGWIPIFAPTPNQPLHIRLVPTEFVGNDPQQPAIKLRKMIVDIFCRKKIRRSTYNTN